MPRAVNPETGEVLFLVDNQWVPPSQTAQNDKGEIAYLVKNQWVLPRQDYVESTSNPFKGMAARAAELAGSGVEAVARVSESAADKLEQAIPLSNISPEDIKNKRQLEPLFQFADKLKNISKDIGYTPSTKLSDLSDNPLTVVPFIAERIISSSPDMAAAVVASPAYITSLSNEILNERLKNDNKELSDATVGDVATAVGAAIFQGRFEKFATERLIKGGAKAKTGAGRITKEGAIQMGTEGIEEGVDYLGGTVGTKKGVDPKELAESIAEGAITGGGLGVGVQGVREILQRRADKEIDAQIKQQQEETKPTPEQSVTAPPVEQSTAAPPPSALQDTAAMLAELEGRPIERPIEAPVLPAQTQQAAIQPQVPVVPTADEVQNVAAKLVNDEAQQLESQGIQQPITDQDLVNKIPEAKNVIIQNRNRATPASIAQMTDIANNLDYDRVSFSKSFNDGAPVVSDTLQISPEFLGKKSTVTTAEGRKIPVQYAVVPADSIVASNNADGTANTEFLNPDSQYAKAIAGNARTAGIQAAYQSGTADNYKQAMITDDLHGIDPKAIESIENPVLVRVMPNDQITSDIGDISNTATNLNLSTIEQAKNDANRIDLEGLQYDENGNLTLSAVRNFVGGMPTTEQANLMDESGNPTRQAMDRIEAAIFQKAYNNDNLTALAHQATDSEAKNIINALVDAAPQMSRLEGAGDYDLRPQLAQAAELAVNARRNNTKLSDLVAQQDMTADPLTYDFLQMFAENPRSAKAISNNLKKLANTAYAQTQQGGTDMFGERQMPTPKDILTQSFAPEQASMDQLPLTMTQRSDMKNELIRQEQINNMNAPSRRVPLTTKNAKAAYDRGDISIEVYKVVQQLEKRYPGALKGLSLFVGDYEGNAALAAQGLERAAEFAPLERLVKLYKSTEGTYNPETIRHEIAHALEQMMPKQTKDQLIAAWSKAIKAAEAVQISDAGKQFFKDLRSFYANPTEAGFNQLIDSMPSNEYYQYITPSEYWAINAEPLLKAKIGGAWSRFKESIKALLEALKNVLGMDNRHVFYKAFDQAVNGEKLTDQILNNYVNLVLPPASTRRNYLGDKPPLANWNMPDDTKIDQFLYKIQDKQIDTRRAIQAINQQVGSIDDKWDAYLKEELYHGRSAKRIRNFLTDELRPILQTMQKNNIDLKDFDDYLHNRHAEERNTQVAKVNPALPDGGSGITTADAQQYLANLDPKKKAIYESLANKVDSIVRGTQKELVNAGLEEQSTIDTWNKTYKHYVPLMREDLDFSQEYTGLGAGFSTRGPASKRAFGSTKSVADIFANIAEQRERAIIRSEKGRVGKAFYGLAITNPNPGFWMPVNPDAISDPAGMQNELINLGLNPSEAKNLMAEPRVAVEDPRTGLVTYQINPILRNRDNVFPVRINGKDRFIFFNQNDPRAKRMVEAIKNLDAQELGAAMGMAAKVTRWIASVNTQYNPVFGAYNFIRDVGGAQFNLSTTAIKGEQAKVMANVFPALRGIYQDLRIRRGEGVPAKGEFAKLWEDFQEQGGATGYRDQFSKNRAEQNILQQEMSALNHGNIRKGTAAVFGWLSDYNDAMENAVRLSAYKVALDKGLTKERAASLAKNLTVNFNRKGELGQQVGALYAFFNASVQGTARLHETLTGPKGKAIIGGGILLGSMQAIALAMMGFDENEPPEFVKQRNLVIPFPDGKYFAIPMPLGLHVIPNIGRLATEMVIGGGDNASKKIVDLVDVLAGTFNPVGNAGLSAQTFAPTLLDPYVAIRENRDNFGRPIAKEDRATNPTPGYTRTRDTASTLSKQLSYYLNLASGGTKYQKGIISPTPDQLDYLIGQATGGVGRELMKAEQTITSLVTGEELPSYKVPLVGRFYGDTSSQASQANQFYDNITRMANHENEIKGRIKNRESTTEYLAENPDARLWRMANRVENEISELNRKKSELIKSNAPVEQVKRIEELRTRKMQQFNEQVRSASGG